MLALVASNDSESGIRDFLCAACFVPLIPPTTREIPLGLAEMQGWFEPSGKQENQRCERACAVALAAHMAAAVSIEKIMWMSTFLPPKCSLANPERMA